MMYVSLCLKIAEKLMTETDLQKSRLTVVGQMRSNHTEEHNIE